MRDWIVAHDLTIDLVTVWVLVGCFATMGAIDVLSWWALRRTRDRTGIGPALKWKKLAVGIAELAMAGLYGLTLVAYYGHYEYGIWWRFGARLVVAAGLLLAGVAGVRFILALRSELNGGKAGQT